MAVGDLPQATALANDLLKTNADSAAVQTAVGNAGHHEEGRRRRPAGL